MKTPPLLLFATLLFWGWQSHLLWWGAGAGAVLEAARIVKLRWELEDLDFDRIWSFCGLALLALGAYVFTTNDAGSGLNSLGGVLHGSAALRNVGNSSTAATTSVLRWLPLVFLPFLVAQVYNVRPTVPLSVISLVLRIRHRRGEPTRYLDISYVYFMVCIFSSGIHTNEGSYFTGYGYFGGQIILILWALWTLRSGRFGITAWLCGLGVMGGLGFAGQAGISRLDRLVQNLDAQLLAHFIQPRTDATEATTSLGQIGELQLSRRIVIRLMPDRTGMVPTYLREASYRLYERRRQTTWSSGGMGFVQMLGQAENTADLLPGKTAPESVNIACYLNGMASQADDYAPRGLLPLPSGTSRLENLPSDTTLETNQIGTVVATGPGLMIFNARYGPGATFDAPPDASTNQVDLVVPPAEAPALDAVIDELHLTHASAADKLLAVREFFAQKFTYSLWQGPEKQGTTNASPLTRFLLTSRSGHCEYFATATVLLLRKLHIPARYAVGYSVHESSGSGFVVRERDAHAWCLAWNQQAGIWEDLDTTPGSWIAMDGRNAVLDWLSDVRSWLVFQFEKLRYGQSNLQQYILWTLVPVGAVLLYYILFQRRKRTRPAGPTIGVVARIVWPGHDSAFYRLEKALAARGLPRQPQELLSTWLERALTEPALAGLREPLRELLQLHYRHRFDPQGLAAAQQHALAQKAAVVLDALGRIKNGGKAAPISRRHG